MLDTDQIFYISINAIVKIMRDYIKKQKQENTVGNIWYNERKRTIIVMINISVNKKVKKMNT